MNISKIRQMASNGDLSVSALRYLLECHGECEHLDFKESLELESDYGCACFGKDALAMKNVGGGYIVVGVEDKSWKPIGLNNKLPYDTKILRDKIRKSTGLDIESDIVHHSIFTDGKELLFAIILIRA
ncbi:MAG TPA: RNA-binding domain-containing protein, partial [Nitrososphaeraceae archaeon]|nr:RNA-binding domain-containing protein [Nitrososphaeraceae archaeon]